MSAFVSKRLFLSKALLMTEQRNEIERRMRREASWTNGSSFRLAPGSDRAHWNECGAGTGLGQRLRTSRCSCRAYTANEFRDAGHPMSA